jgi:hypothetical protein
VHPQLGPIGGDNIVHAVPLELEPVAETQLAPALDEGWEQQLVPRRTRGIELQVQQLLLSGQRVLLPGSGDSMGGAYEDAEQYQEQLVLSIQRD